MKVLVTGADGQLGYEVCKRLAELNINSKGADICDFDICDFCKTQEYIKAYKPDAVVHCAAYTAVDKAESHPLKCEKVNALGTENIARACQSIGAKMVYISTDYVFSGEDEGLYEPNSPVNPQNVYGKTKLEGEKRVKEILDEYFIVRTSWVFGINGSNFVKIMLALAETKNEISVVCDQKGSPTYAPDLANLVCSMLVTQRYGTYHATNEGICSWYEFAQEIFALAGSKVQVVPILTKDYKTDAKRPLNSALSKECLEKNGFSRLPHWKDALQRFIHIQKGLM